jgi:hypothetical protein
MKLKKILKIDRKKNKTLEIIKENKIKKNY